MAQYKVPQDVEADDKLLGPFSFRQFVYLMIIGGLIGLGVLLWQVFPPFIVILIPPIILLGALALPLKKDQPMETYLSAVVSFYLKPHVRTWEPGEPETTIKITAPKKTEKIRTKDIDQEEALHRLSFLADIIDTEGYAIKGTTLNSGVKEEVYAEAHDTPDMFENTTASNNLINQTLTDGASARHDLAISQMRAAIENNARNQNTTITNHNGQLNQQIPQQTTQPQTMQQHQAYPMPQPPALPDNPVINNPSISAPKPIIPSNPLSDEAVKYNDTIIKSDSMVAEIEAERAEQERIQQEEAEEKRQAEIKEVTEQTNQNMIDLANNSDFSIETIAQQAKRIKEKKDDEVYISLH